MFNGGSNIVQIRTATCPSNNTCIVGVCIRFFISTKTNTRFQVVAKDDNYVAEVYFTNSSGIQSYVNHNRVTPTTNTVPIQKIPPSQVAIYLNGFTVVVDILDTHLDVQIRMATANSVPTFIDLSGLCGRWNTYLSFSNGSTVYSTTPQDYIRDYAESCMLFYSFNFVN